MKIRVAFYGRYSRAEQDPVSISGQFVNCTAIAERHGFEVVARYKDEGISGEADDRPGFLALLAASECGSIDGIVADESSRLSRGPGALPRLVALLNFRKQFVVCRDFDSRGESSQLLAAVFSGVDNLEVERTRQRTRQPLWDAAQARLAEKRSSAAKKAGRRGTYLLSGLLKCSHCGGNLSMVNKVSYGCGTRHHGGDAACDNAFLMRRDEAEALYIDAVRKELRDPAVRRAAESEIARTLAADYDDSEAVTLRKDLADVSAEVERVVGAICKVGVSAALESKLKELEQRQQELRGALANAERAVVLPDQVEIAKKWDGLIDTLGEFPRKLRTRSEVEAARGSVLSYISQMKVDRHGKGRADLQCLVAGTRLVLICCPYPARPDDPLNIRPIKFRVNGPAVFELLALGLTRPRHRRAAASSPPGDRRRCSHEVRLVGDGPLTSPECVHPVGQRQQGGGRGLRAGNRDAGRELS